jgi:hypothetical protein
LNKSKIMKQLYFLLTAFLFVFSNINAQTVSTVNSEGAWTAYMNWFENDNGSKGASVGGGNWDLAKLKTTLTSVDDATYPNGAVTLQPNFNAYADNVNGDANAQAYWTDGSGGGNKWMEAISKIEYDAGKLNDTSLSFVGTVSANTLDNAYSAVAFIKTLDPAAGYATVIFETVALGAAGSSFAVSASGIDAAHIVQYGFIVEGINANPANEAALGNVVVTPNSLKTSDPEGAWTAYMNWFENDNGSKGASVGGGNWDLAKLKTTLTSVDDATYPNGAVTLQPNFNAYADNVNGDANAQAYWTDGSGGGNKWMEAISKIEYDAGKLNDTSLSFVGTVSANTLDNAYSAVAFIKTLDPAAGYATVIFETVALGAAGSSFAVSASGIDAAHIVQYGFIVEGINANPANEAALGNVVVTPFISGFEEPDYTNLTVDVSQTWKGFISWFNNNNGAQGDYIAGQPWENINLVKTTITAAGDSSYPNGAIKLQPNFSLYADNENGDAEAQAYWLDGNGKGNKFLEGNSFVEYAAGEFTDGALKFVGNVEINGIYLEEYTVVAFIKTINANTYETVINKTVELGADGTSFEVKASGINSADIVQYGFSVRGLNANPTGETFLGGVTVTPNADFLPDPAPTDAPTTPPSRNTSDVISVFGEAYNNAIGLNNVTWDAGSDSEVITIAGNQVLKITFNDFIGFDLGSVINATDMTHVHMDVWIGDVFAAGQVLKPTWSNHAGGNGQTDSFENLYPVGAEDSRKWISIDYEFANSTTTAGVGKDARAELAQFLIGSAATLDLIYVDNIYIYKGTPLSFGETEGFNFVAYPNPVKNTLNVSAAVAIDAVSIFDLTGREVLRTTPNAAAFSLDVSSLKKGLYLVTVKAGEQELNTKLVK